ALAPPDGRVKVEVTGEWNRPPMNPGPATGRVFALAAGVARDLGGELGQISVGGASDGNLVAALGKPVLDGLGAAGSGPHPRAGPVRSRPAESGRPRAAGLPRHRPGRAMPPLPAPAEGTAGYPPRGGRGTLPGWRPPDRNALRGAGPQPEGHAVITRPGLRGV